MSDIKEKEEIIKKKRSFSAVAKDEVEKKNMVTSTVTFTLEFREHISIFAKRYNYGTLQSVVEDALKKLMKEKDYDYEK